MKFKKFYLKEAQNRHKIDEFIFSKRPFLPLSEKMIDRIFGIKKVTALHSTDIDGLNILKKIQGTKKSISTFTSIKGSTGYSEIFSGVETEGGVIVKVEGNLLIRGSEDLFTWVDNQGRRWISLDDMMIAENLKSKLKIIINNIKNMLFDKYQIKWYKPKGKIGVTSVGELPEFWKSSDWMGSFEVPKDIKGKLVKDFFDMIEKTIKTPEIKKLFDELLEKNLETYFEYDEVVINNIKVKEVYILAYVTSSSKLTEEEYEEDIKKKIKDFKVGFIHGGPSFWKYEVDKLLKEVKRKNGF